MAPILDRGERMRKPVRLAVLGLSIVVSAVSLGVTLTRYLGLRAYSPKGASQAASAPAGRNAPAPPPEEWNNLFAPGDGMTMASRLPAANAKSASPAQRTGFILLGTIVSSTPSARRAILWANGMKEPKAFREKEEVEPGALLSSIVRDKVWIARGKEREKLEILPVGTRGRPAATALPADAPPGASAAPTPAPSPGSTPRAGSVAAPPASPGAVDGEPPGPRERRRRSRGNLR